MSIAIAAEHVTVVRGDRTLLRDVSLHLAWGELVALVGPNGAGKSTLLACMAGDTEPTSGQITLSGVPLASIGLKERARKRAVLPQQCVLQFGFSARDVAAMGRAPLPPASREDDERAVDRALQQTEAHHFRDRPFPRLSGGEQHRVSIARILAQESPLLLLDEPTAALDIRHQHMVMEVAHQVASSGGAVLTILHDLNLALSYATRIGVLRFGELVAYDVPEAIADETLLSEVFEHPIRVDRGPECLTVVPQPHSRAADRLQPVAP